MPELPEVEQFKKFFTQSSLLQTIHTVKVQHLLVLDQITPSQLQTALIGQQFETVKRHGKYLFAKAADIWLTLHFGMSGYLHYCPKTHEPFPHDRVTFSFSNNNRLIYHCQRMFGRLSLTDSLETFIQQKHLGPDALAIDFDTFYNQLRPRHGIIKTTLMNQQILAGIGNLYADEILFQTGIHPITKLNTLTDTQLQQIFNTIKEILSTAIMADADFERYPSSYLLRHRSKGMICPRDNTPLQQIKISGRTAYFCPTHQTK